MERFAPYKNFLAVLLFTVCIFIISPSSAAAAPMEVSMSYCKLNKTGTTVTVKAKVHQMNPSLGENLYLIALDAHAPDTGIVDTIPLAAQKNEEGTLKFKVNYENSMLYQKFAVAFVSEGMYQIISNTFYITNPQVLATYTGNGPATVSKKGLQAENTADALNLRAQHVVLNWTINSILGEGQGSIPFEYRGATYYFNANTISYYDRQVQAFHAAGIKVTIILLLPNNIYAQTDAMRFTGSDTAKYSSVNTAYLEGCRTFEAMMTYLASHYGTEDNLVSGWILGNEVNNQSEWNYGGGENLSSYMSNYARAFRICSNAVKSVSKNTKVYISLDYNWNLDADDSGNNFFSTKATLNEFYDQIKNHGKIVFQIAYHAYPEALSDPVFWDDSHAVNSADTDFITFNNLNVLTDYVRTYFGKEYTIMLSEQSFNSTKGEAVQAAAYAYAYYKAEADEMIESFIYGRQYDHPVETAQGFFWGLHDFMQKKRIIWDVFQYIDTAESFLFTNQLVKYTNLVSWFDISGFDPAKFGKMPTVNRETAIDKIVMKSPSSASVSWKKVNFADGYQIFRNGKKIKTINSNEILSYTDKKLKTGTTYDYKVRAYKRVPSESDANKRTKMYANFTDTKKMTACPAPVAWAYDDLYNLADGSQIKLKWVPQKGVTGYKVLRSTSMDSNYVTVATLPETAYTDRNTQTGVTYYYKIRAYTTVNDKTYHGKTSEPIGIESQMQLTGALSSDAFSLSWTDWRPDTVYCIYASAQTDGEYQKIAETVNTYWSSAENPDLAPYIAQMSCFKVCALLPDGTTSAFSNIVTLAFAAPEFPVEGAQTDILLDETEQIPAENTEMAQ